jgi:hypothetical protein
MSVTEEKDFCRKQEKTSITGKLSRVKCANVTEWAAKCSFLAASLYGRGTFERKKSVTKNLCVKSTFG